MSDQIYEAVAPRRDNAIGVAKTLFAVAAGVSFLLSVYLYFSGSHQQGIFVGLWVPSILSAGNLVLAGRS